MTALRTPVIRSVIYKIVARHEGEAEMRDNLGNIEP
ncbi:Uncharacterised protein [Legionella spiritensis]|nr:Uncharacterised protein [Legionella spiritensis]